MSRQCSRSGCAQPATVTLSYQYARAIVWLDDLLRVRDPHNYDLCQRHSTKMTVPKGWQIEDRRSPRELVYAGGPRLNG